MVSTVTLYYLGHVAIAGHMSKNESTEAILGKGRLLKLGLEAVYGDLNPFLRLVQIKSSFSSRSSRVTNPACPHL